MWYPTQDATICGHSQTAQRNTDLRRDVAGGDQDICHRFVLV